MISVKVERDCIVFSGAQSFKWPLAEIFSYRIALEGESGFPTLFISTGPFTSEIDICAECKTPLSESQVEDLYDNIFYAINE